MTVTLTDQAQDIELAVYGKASLADLFGDFVLFRNLEPVDKRIPGLNIAYGKMGLTSPRIPRKLQPEYARATAWILRRARELDAPNTELRELLYIGDTALNDSNAYRNLRQACKVKGWCFIGSEKPDQEPRAEIEEDQVYVSNRWTGLATWLRWVLSQGAKCNKHTVVVVDIDKTAAGARGRNAQAIDKARLLGVERTVTGTLGDNFDQALFLQAYHTLNQPEFHPLTADNQDYLAYICLILGAGLLALDELLEDVRAGRMVDFHQFLRWADFRLSQQYVPGVSEIHDSICNLVKRGDPTPFKRFRRNEFLATIELMGNLPDDAPMSQRLDEEICITQEVREICQWVKARDCLLFALSDKPDEASLPTPEHAEQGIPPVHRAVTHCVGESIADRLSGL